MNSKNRIKEYYQKYGSHWAELYDAHLKPSVFKRMEYGLELAKQINAKRVLDAGCGTGHFVRLMRSAGFICDGMDLSPEMLRSSPEFKQADKGVLVEGDLTVRSDYPPHEYNLVTAFGVFVHEIDEGKTLDNFRQKLSADGRVLISFRNILFSLFALNKHTLGFYKTLLSGVGLSENERQLVEDHFTRCCSQPVGARKSGQQEFEEVFHKFHNPLTIGSLFSQHGFGVENILYLNMHPVPPALADKVSESERKAEDMQDQFGNAWQGMFLASSFLVTAKCNDSRK